MSGRRILIFSLFFCILSGSLFYYVLLPRIVSRSLRRDSIPAGAYIIPWMRPNPSFEELNLILPGEPPWDVDAAMVNALRLEMTFRIVVPDQTRVIPSTVYLGHDTDYLYIGGVFRGMYLNPASHPPDDPELVLPNDFTILFDAAHDGVLRFPESGSGLGVSLFEDATWHTGAAWQYHDMVWINNLTSLRRGIWDLAENYYSPNPQPAYSLRAVVTEYDNSTGTLIVLFSRYLSRPALGANALQMRTGERWVMGFLIELGYTTWIFEGEDPLDDYVDGWPRKTYPYLDNDSSWWPKLVIDLANPPPEFST